MFRTILNHVQSNSDITSKNITRCLSYKAIKFGIRSIFYPQRVKPPYTHVCQIGDPVLRAEATPVEPEVVTTASFQRVIKHLSEVMRKYQAVGLSATQIGLSYQIFVIEVTEKHLESLTPSKRKAMQMELIPYKVFINPKMKIVDYALLRYSEECLSILGYSAVVPRAKTVRVDALDITGKPFYWIADGWSARIVQHEMDHLQGKMYVDRMDPSTFSCTFWSTINSKSGDVLLKFHPRSWYQRFF